MNKTQDDKSKNSFNNVIPYTIRYKKTASEDLSEETKDYELESTFLLS
jgi:hypothetical protein